jgi:Domain of unknown function (DUF1707)
MVEGRLSANELEERLHTLFTARTYAELDALLADLPVSRPPAEPRARVAGWAGALAAGTLMIAVLGVLATARVHSAVAIGGPGGSRHFRFQGPFGYAHHQLLVGPYILGAFAVVVVCFALFCLLTPSVSESDG